MLLSSIIMHAESATRRSVFIKLAVQEESLFIRSFRKHCSFCFVALHRETVKIRNVRGLWGGSFNVVLMSRLASRVVYLG